MLSQASSLSGPHGTWFGDCLRLTWRGSSQAHSQPEPIGGVLVASGLLLLLGAPLSLTGAGLVVISDSLLSGNVKLLIIQLQRA